MWLLVASDDAPICALAGGASLSCDGVFTAWCDGPSAATLRRAVFNRNAATGASAAGGGALALPNSRLTVLDSTFADNAAGSAGGGLSFGAAEWPLVVGNTTFVRNVAASGCGGLSVGDAESVNLSASIFVNNTARSRQRKRMS